MSPLVETILIALAVVLAPLVAVGAAGTIGTIYARRRHGVTVAELAVERARERGVAQRAELRRFYRQYLRAVR